MVLNLRAFAYTCIHDPFICNILRSPNRLEGGAPETQDPSIDLALSLQYYGDSIVTIDNLELFQYHLNITPSSQTNGRHGNPM